MKCKTICFALAMCGIAAGVSAQSRDVSVKIYGKVEGNWQYNSRNNYEGMEGLVHLYPKDILLDPNGKDLNSVRNAGTYMIETRLGVDIFGPEFLNAKTSAKIEFDFRGLNSDLYTLRLRHAYINLDWGKSAALFGQTWHPMTHGAMPTVLSLSAGMPFQPFARVPQLRYTYKEKGWTFTAAALWQSQDASLGPRDNVARTTATRRSTEFLRYGGTPEGFIGVDYQFLNFKVGAGVLLTSLKLRTQSLVGGTTYKVDERLTTLSGMFQFKYSNAKLDVAGKSVLGTNFTQANNLGGYGIVSSDAVTGEQEYAPLRVSSSWIDIGYGRKWRPSVFVGYMKNLGATKDVIGIAGSGTELKQLGYASFTMAYLQPHWRVGLEYGYTRAWYGDAFDNRGKATSTHKVNNNRIYATISYLF